METATFKISKKKYDILMLPKKYNIDIDSFKGIDGNKGVMQEPSWRAIPLGSQKD